MGEFSSGRWIVGLSLYFFTFFLIVYSFLGGAEAMNASETTTPKIDTTGIYADEPGFSSLNNQPYLQYGECTGRPNYFCSSIGFDDNLSCSLPAYPGCYWHTNILGEEGCVGVFEGICEDYSDDRNCTMVGCTWSNYTSTGAAQVQGVTNTGFDWSSIKDTIGVMAGGMNADIGLPWRWAFVGSFLFFWLPFFMLSWSIYMALPFLH
jgi:hypothetical protein